MITIKYLTKHIWVMMAILLLLCLLPMPYGYYTLIRFVAMIIFGYSAYTYYKEQKEGLMVTMIALAILFQPLLPISLGRTMWNIIDIAIAIFLLYLWYKEQFTTKKEG